jgi:hypothetical protein
MLAPTIKILSSLLRADYLVIFNFVQRQDAIVALYHAELREFVDTEVPGYAILSHRWERDEVTFQDMPSGDAKRKARYSKIVGCAKQALAEDCEYNWVDTAAEIKEVALNYRRLSIRCMVV